jgi:S1-C subfamily serine protease
MMNGTMVDNTVIGGPAYNSKQLAHGDVILEVDGKEAKNENIFELFIGSDIPGSAVNIKLARGGATVIRAYVFPPVKMFFRR